MNEAIIHKSDEDLEVEWYLHRGRKLADQAHWAQLCEEIRHLMNTRPARRRIANFRAADPWCTFAYFSPSQIRI